MIVHVREELTKDSMLAASVIAIVEKEFNVSVNHTCSNQCFIKEGEIGNLPKRCGPKGNIDNFHYTITYSWHSKVR
jgi:hypothetical protein